MISGEAVVFTDVPQSAWFSTYVQQSAEAGIVSGYKDAQGELTGSFGPSNSITVAEALKIAVEGAGYDEEVYGRMVHSGVSHWSSAYVSVAEAEGFAITDGSVVLDSPASRAEVASIFASAFRVNTENNLTDTRYEDVSASTEFSTSIEALSRDGVVSGDTDIHGEAVGTFRPYESINRAEVAKMVIEARGSYGTPGEGREPSQEAMYDGNVIIYDNTGFQPEVLRVSKGDAVTFRNESTLNMWVASDPHPVHTALSSFDSLQAKTQGETYVYTFTQAGTWTFHNHVQSSHKGTVIVE